MKTGGYFSSVFLLAIITASVFGQVIPVDRITDWTLAGYPNKIPVYSPIKNITNFGGNGDGISTNDLALQQAISSLNNEQGIVYFPAGTYLFNKPILLGNGILPSIRSTNQKLP